MQSMDPPPWFHKDLKSDIDALIWDRQIEFDPDQDGSKKRSRPWIRKEAVNHPKRLNVEGEGLGLGLIDWESHCSAIKIAWLLKYRDATDAPWKKVLDAWFANSVLDRGAIFSTLPVKELTAHLDPVAASIGLTSHLSNFWKKGLSDLKNKIKIIPNLKTSTREGLEGYPVWHNPLFNMPRELSQFKRLWEHLCANTLDDLFDDRGRTFDYKTLESYLTEDNGVAWQRDQTTIKITLCDNESRVVDARSLLESWQLITKAIPDWCLKIIRKPRLRPNSILPTQGGAFQLLPTHVLTTPEDRWFLIFPHGCYPAVRDWRGRLSISGPPVASLPEDAEHAAKWGNGYIQAKRNSFPVAAEFTLEGDDTPLDKLSVKRLTYLISKRERKPPSCIKNGPKSSPLSQEGLPP